MIKMIRKHIIKCAFGVACFVTTLSASAALVPVDMTTGIWTITGSDTAGVSWDGSTIKFETQTASNNDWLLTGFFQWTASSGAFGGEDFTGTLFEDRSLHMDGIQIVSPASGIVLGIYDAALAASNNDIVNGQWGGPGIPSNMWTATRVIPVPAAIWLFGSGLLGLIGIARRKKTA